MARSTKPKKLKAFNPATGEQVGEVQANSPAEVSEAVALARKVAPEWGAIPPAGRARILKDVRHRIYNNMDDIVETVATECGKPRAEALVHDVMPAVMALQYFERVAPKALRPDHPGRIIGPLLGVSSKVEWRPFGVVGCISPWNYPFQLAIFAIAPALFAGNTVVLKPSEVTPGVGERLRAVLEGLPPGVASIVQGGADVGQALVDAPCNKVCFIGSPATGRKIAGAAAKHLTPVVMELGGQDAAIVCEDADVDVASSGVLWGAFLNSGQTCAAIERAYVVDGVADEFIEQLSSKLAKLHHEEDGDIGALTTSAGLETVTRLVEDSVRNGATVVAGGPDEVKKGAANGGRWYPPTILEGRSEEMALFKEEIFGPVLPIVRVRDEAEAVRRANEDGFSLTASVWTGSRARFDRLAGELRAGTISSNDHASTAGAVWTPWGGVGESGYGRINGVYGLREFSVPVHVARSLLPNMKKVWWYPYDAATTETLRAVSDAIAAPTVREKARAVRVMIGSFGRAVKNKL